ncbi:hypothetical protein [Endozoicomonas numazuensis]|uniref:Uncharacterized protein n=1 Tax=Endozoicomonas numazuensis TaxID=1137799 RepID=A0A081NFW0_9GAMM|nr:hypothetical protein [Endozoicomonas numazuensis]KEQ17333.1 hypothetical protein GZ78_16105 [Endozoicomonas numazuensis]
MNGLDSSNKYNRLPGVDLTLNDGITGIFLINTGQRFSKAEETHSTETLTENPERPEEPITLTEVLKDSSIIRARRNSNKNQHGDTGND